MLRKPNAVKAELRQKAHKQYGKGGRVPAFSKDRYQIDFSPYLHVNTGVIFNYATRCTVTPTVSKNDTMSTFLNKRFVGMVEFCRSILQVCEIKMDPRSVEAGKQSAIESFCRSTSDALHADKGGFKSTRQAPRT